MKGVLLHISGFVQGVGYRKFVKQHAQKLGIVGWIQNMPDGTVEAKAFGSPDVLHTFIELCKKGVFLAEVKEVKTEWIEEDTPPIDFSVISSR